MVRQAPVAERMEQQLHAPAPKRRKSPIWAKAFVGVGALLLLVSTGTYAGTKLVGAKIENTVNRGDLLGDSVKEEVPPKVEGPLVFLMIGSDSRAGKNSNPNNPDGNVLAVPGERSDTIIMVYVPKSMDRAYLVSFPRDSYVPIANKSGNGTSGKDKINSAFAFGGAPRLVKTVNNLTGMKVDYPVIVNFSAIHKITDMVGGVDVVVDQTSYDEYRFMPKNTPYPTTPCRDTRGKKQRCLTFKKGPLHLNGELAEYYVRQRTGLPRGDLDRAKRQQQFMRALMSKAASGDTLTDPVKFSKLVTAVAESLTVDKRMPVQALAYALKGLRTSDLVFMTLPVRGLGNEPGAGSVVYPDMPKVTELFSAMQNDTLDAWMLKNQPNDVTHGA
jgi:LCP family protein required for cell wall assembly